jgi:hypothetical protein
LLTCLYKGFENELYSFQKKLFAMSFPCVSCSQPVRPRQHALECESCIELDNEFFFLNFSDEQKLVYLQNPASVRHVRVIGFYLKRSLETIIIIKKNEEYSKK